MLKLIGSLAVGAMLLVSCTSTALLSSGSPTPSAGAASPAADLRTHMNLLMGEHVFIVAKLSSAANAGRKTQFSSYAGLLATNGSDLIDLMTRSIGDSSGRAFATAWAAGNAFAVDYVIAAATHDVAAKQATLTNEANTYTTNLAEYLISHGGMESEGAAQQAADEAGGIRAVIDDQVAGDFARAYSDLHAAYQHASSLGDAMGIAIAHQFPDRLPGDPTLASVVHRTTLDSLLQERALLTTMAAESVVGGGSKEQGPAGSTLAQSSSAVAGELGAIFGATVGAGAQTELGSQDTACLAYAAATTDAQRQAVLATLRDVSAPRLAGIFQGHSAQKLDFAAQAVATVQVVEAQRSKSSDQVAQLDRSAAQLLVEIGEILTGGTATQQVD